MLTTHGKATWSKLISMLQPLPAVLDTDGDRCYACMHNMANCHKLDHMNIYICSICWSYLTLKREYDQNFVDQYRSTLQDNLAIDMRGLVFALECKKVRKISLPHTQKIHCDYCLAPWSHKIIEDNESSIIICNHCLIHAESYKFCGVMLNISHLFHYDICSIIINILYDLISPRDI